MSLVSFSPRKKDSKKKHPKNTSNQQFVHIFESHVFDLPDEILVQIFS